jgi:flagellar protein FliO/FliZ
MRKFALAWIAVMAVAVTPTYAQDRAANAQVEKPAAQDSRETGGRDKTAQRGTQANNAPSTAQDSLEPRAGAPATETPAAAASDAAPSDGSRATAGAAAARTTAQAPSGRPFAAPEVADSPPVGGATGLGQVTLSLAIVLGAIFAVAWLAKRMRTLGRGPGAVMDVIAEIQLGPKERAVLLRVGTKQILVGVATGGVTPLHVLDTPIEIPAPTAALPNARPNFRDLLMRSLGKAP